MLGLSGAILLAAVLLGCSSSSSNHGFFVSTPQTMQIVSGDNQTGAISTPLPEPLVVRVTDTNGNPQQNVPVTFAVTSGGGSLSQTSLNTASDGTAETKFTLGPIVGPQLVTASIAGTATSSTTTTTTTTNNGVGNVTTGTTTGVATVTTSTTPLPVVTSVTFTENAVQTVASAIQLTSGSNQQGTPGSTLPAPLVVTVVGPNSEPIAGVPVAFTVTSGTATVSPPVATSGQNGQAQTVVTLGQTLGTVTIVASVNNGTISQTFTQSIVSSSGGGGGGTGGAIAAVTSNDLQTGTVGSPLASPMIVTLTQNGHPVANVPITFAVKSGQGTLSETSTNTNAQGQASTILTLGDTVGVTTVSATATGISTPILFRALAQAGPPAQIAISVGNDQTASAGTILVQPLAVSLLDQFNNPVPNFPVTFAVASGTGQLSNTSPLSNDQGIAQTLLTLGSAAGATTVTAQAGALASVTFSETSTAPSTLPTQMQLTSGNDQSAMVGTAVPAPLVVTVLNASSVPVQGATVNFVSANAVGAVVSGSTTAVMTDASGNASFTPTLDPLDGTNTVLATANGPNGKPLTGSPITFTLTGTPGPAAGLAFTEIPRAVQVNTPFTLVVAIVDSFGNVVTSAPATAITLALGTNPFDATLGGTLTATTSSGVATFSGLTLDKVGRGATIVASSSSFSVTSLPIEVATPPVRVLGPGMPTPRFDLGAAVGSDGRIYAIGGRSTGGTALAVVEALNVTQMQWTTSTPLPAPRYSFGTAATAGKIFVIGGFGSDGTPLSSVLTFDPTTAVWSVGPAMPTARGGLAAAVGQNGSIFAIGGRGISGKVLSTVEVFNPTTGIWTTGPSIPIPNVGISAVTGQDGRIYVLGGTGLLVSGAVFALSPNGTQWTQAATLPNLPSGVAADLGSDGRIDVWGDYETANVVVQPSPPPSTQAPFATFLEINTERSELAAVSGPDGRSYGIGGRDAQGNALALVESFSPTVVAGIMAR
jgi:hypothetical protein